MSIEATASEIQPPVAAAARTDAFRLGLLSLGHAVTDTYGFSLLAPMLPTLKAQMGLTLAQIGAIPVIMSLTASLAQPLIGWVSDKRPNWCLVAWGPLLAALFLGFVGRVHTYAAFGMLIFMAGIGIGAFHPQGASLARNAGRGSGLAMSAFTVGGNVGFGLAPILGMAYAVMFGLDRLYFAAVPAAIYAAFMLYVFHTSPDFRTHNPLVARRKAGPSNPGALAALTGSVVVRSAVQMGTATFLPFLIAERFPPELREPMKGIAVSVFLLAGAFAGPIGGHLSDRYGRRLVMILSFLLAPWPLLAAVSTSGFPMVALLSCGAFILMLPHPGNVVMAQEFMPGNTGIAASLITGLAFGLGQLLVLPLGGIADHTSIGATLTGLSLFPLAGTLLVLRIPERAPVQEPV